MYELTNISVIRELLSRHGFAFTKSLGQNFLTSPFVVEEIAHSACTSPDIGIIEIGPGMGTLTAQLCKLAEKVVAIEIDRKLIPVLQDTMGDFDNFTLIHADVMKTDLNALIDEHFAGMEVVICANLPYYITTPILTMILENRVKVKRMVAMMQKEVAKRVCADPDTADYGAITLAVQYYSAPEILFDVAPGNFIPAPKVTSSVVNFTVLGTPPVQVKNEKLYFSLIKAAFSQRRKTLQNALSNQINGIDKQQLHDVMERIGLPANIRGEALGAQQFAALSDAIEQLKR